MIKLCADCDGGLSLRSVTLFLWTDDNRTDKQSKAESPEENYKSSQLIFCNQRET